MAVLAMPSGKSEGKSRSAYTWYGRISFGLMADRDIRNPTELFRRIEALGGYPRRLSPATIINIFKGEQGAPFEFQQYLTVTLDQAKPLSGEEKEELEDAFVWGQKHVADAGYTHENIERAHEYVKEMRRKHGDGNTD